MCLHQIFLAEYFGQVNHDIYLIYLKICFIYFDRFFCRVSFFISLLCYGQNCPYFIWIFKKWENLLANLRLVSFAHAWVLWYISCWPLTLLAATRLSNRPGLEFWKMFHIKSPSYGILMNEEMYQGILDLLS